MFAAKSLPKITLSRPVAGAIGLLLWGTTVLAGFQWIARYETTAGPPPAPAPQWPAEAPVALEPGRANLFLFAHPKCPCTRASLTELARIIVRTSGRLQATVLFYVPADESPDWRDTALWHTAAAIPGVRVLADVDGALAARLGASTSGQVVLFDDAGRAVFTGGITGARGHEGDNLGEDYVIALALGRVPASRHTPVFGCSL